MNIQMDSHKTCKHCGWPSRGIYCFECSAMFTLESIGYKQNWVDYRTFIDRIDSLEVGGWLIDGVATVDRAKSNQTISQ